MKKYLSSFTRVDHVAIAVKDLEEAVFLYQDVFGFELIKKREVFGEFSGMKSAELDAGGFSIVLIQGTCPDSQVTRYVDEYGPGVQHIAIEVNNLEAVFKTLDASGVKFVTDLIKGNNLVQIFTQRDKNSGMMIEFIQRKNNTDGFETNNIQQLFNQLEANDAY
jgi:methylmalonyl-CoA/ethylmalonyl-CoA epimerase